MSQPLLPPPKPLLRRSRATDFVEEESHEATRLRAQVLRAFDALPFKGPALVLDASNTRVVDDVWRAALEATLEDMPAAHLALFDLEQWLGERLAMDGTPAQQAAFERLLAELDEPTPVSAIPFDIGEVMLTQPRTEIEVYRGVDDLLTLDQLDLADDEDPAAAAEDAVPPAEEETPEDA
mmetsp:Transcript_534/g.2095  ORF Transcript_534/g.2095 Transcript_534/m.2095 type:complete len:180 (+) Transcript_534:150-689(+)